MKKTPRALRWVISALTLFALTLGIGATTVATTAAPAQAATSITLCFPVYGSNGQIIDWQCFEIPLAIEKCPLCPYVAIGFDDLILPPETAVAFPENLVKGMDLLTQAQSADPRRAAYLRGQAQQAFLVAARLLDGADVNIGEVGVPDFRAGVIRPEPDPWLEAAGTDVGNGITMFQVAVANPDPTPWIEAGMRDFENAIQQITQQQVQR